MLIPTELREKLIYILEINFGFAHNYLFLIIMNWGIVIPKQYNTSNGGQLLNHITETHNVNGGCVLFKVVDVVRKECTQPLVVTKLIIRHVWIHL